MTPRLLASPFVSEWRGRTPEAQLEAERLRTEIGTAMQERRWGELMPFTGQTTGRIREVLSVAEVVRRTVEEAEAILRSRAPR